MSPHSRRDKDISNNYAINMTIRVFQVVEFSIQPFEP